MNSAPYHRFESASLILRDELALDRTILANERTLLAYARTSLASIVTGAGIMRLFDGWEPWILGVCMISLGLVVMFYGTWRFLRVSRSLALVPRQTQPMQPTDSASP